MHTERAPLETIYVLGHKTRLNTFKRNEIIQRMCSAPTTMELNKINNRRKIWKFINMWILSNGLLNNQLYKEESQKN